MRITNFGVLLALLLCSCGKLPHSSVAVLKKAQGTPITSTVENNPATNGWPATHSQRQNQTERNRATRIGGYLEVGFDKLSDFPASVVYEGVSSNTPAFYYAPKLVGSIPAEIKALDGKDVAIQGFMLPLRGDAGRVQEFILLKNQSMCCFGLPPKINEWIHVRVKGQGLKPLMDQVVTIYGTLQVGEYSENRQILGLYRLQGDGMSIPRQF